MRSSVSDSLLRFAARKYVEVRSPSRSRNGGPQRPGVVAATGGLDLDDPGAEVAQHHRGVRAGQGAGEVDDEDAREGAGAGLRGGTIADRSRRSTSPGHGSLRRGSHGRDGVGARRICRRPVLGWVPMTTYTLAARGHPPRCRPWTPRSRPSWPTTRDRCWCWPARAPARRPPWSSSSSTSSSAAGWRPTQVLALTFSRKAAESLRDRVTARLGRTLGLVAERDVPLLRLLPAAPLRPRRRLRRAAAAAVGAAGRRRGARAARADPGGRAVARRARAGPPHPRVRARGPDAAGPRP